MFTSFRVELLIKLFAGETLLTLEDMDEVCSWHADTPKSGNPSSVLSSDDKINSCKQDCVRLIATRPRITTSLNIEHPRNTCGNIFTTTDNSEEYLQENADLGVGVNDRRRSGIDTKEPGGTWNGKADSLVGLLAKIRPAVLNNEGRENPIHGSEPSTVERYISLDPLDEAASGFHEEEAELELERSRLLLRSVLLPSILVKSASGATIFENDSNGQPNPALTGPTRNEPTAEIPPTASKGKHVVKVKQDGRLAMATIDAAIATVRATSNLLTVLC